MSITLPMAAPRSKFYTPNHEPRLARRWDAAPSQLLLLAAARLKEEPEASQCGDIGQTACRLQEGSWPEGMWWFGAVKGRSERAFASSGRPATATECMPCLGSQWARKGGTPHARSPPPFPPPRVSPGEGGSQCGGEAGHPVAASPSPTPCGCLSFPWPVPGHTSWLH